MASQQELNHAKAQCLDAQRAEKLHKVDYQQLEKKVPFKILFAARLEFLVDVFL